MKTKLLTYFTLLTVLIPAVAKAEAIEWASGEWGIDRSEIDQERIEEIEGFRRCGESPVIVSIDKAKMRYKAVHKGEDDFTVEGYIITANQLYISIEYDDETRTFKNGETQIWHMFFDGPDRFYWVLAPIMQRDAIEGVTEARERCVINAI